MVSRFISRLVILISGALFPAYCSYKTVKTKDVRNYVKWMMYWIVFAVFICTEAFVDVLVAFWLPFYYELKILFVFWLLSPYTKGAIYLYRNFLHPQLVKHEREIDEYFDKAKADGCRTFGIFLSRIMTRLKEAITAAALNGQEQFVIQMRKTVLFSEVNDLDALVKEEECKATNVQSSDEPIHTEETSGLQSSNYELAHVVKDSTLSNSNIARPPTVAGYSSTLGYSSLTRRYNFAPRVSVSGSTVTKRMDYGRYNTMSGAPARSSYLTRSNYGFW